MHKIFFNHDKNKPEIDGFFNQYGFNEISDISNVSKEIIFHNGLIIFAHTRNQDQLDKLINVVQDKKERHLILMSSDPDSIAINESSNVHKCHFPADRLRKFTRAAEFFECLNDGELNFELLSPKKRGSTGAIESSNLIALSILCQGYLAVHALSKSRRGEDIQEALDKMGWSDKVAAQFPDLSSKLNTVRDRGWWLDGFGQSVGLKEAVLNELGGAVAEEREDIERLVSNIESPHEAFEVQEQCVARAYLAVHALLSKI